MDSMSQLYHDSIRPLPPADRLRLAALIVGELAAMDHSFGNGTEVFVPEPEFDWLDKLSPEEDEAALRRAEAMMPSHEELRALIASGLKPEFWYDGDEPLF